MQHGSGIRVFVGLFWIAGLALGAGCGGSGAAQDDTSGSGSGVSSEDPAEVRKAFVDSCATLTRILDNEAKLVCQAESSRAAFRSLQAFLQNIVAQQFSQFSLQDLLAAITTGTGAGQDSIDEILNRPDMVDLGNRLLRHTLPVLKKLLGKEEYDFVCAPDRSVWPEFQFASTMKWVQEDLLADDLIVDQGPGTISFKVVAERACKGWGPLNLEAWFKDLIPDCKEIVQAAALQLTLTLTQANEIQATVKFNAGKDTLLGFVVNADRNRLTIPVEPANVIKLLRSIGTAEFVGEGSQAGGALSISLTHKVDATVELTVAVTSPLELSINFRNGDKKIGQAKLKIASADPLLSGRFTPDGAFALSLYAGPIALTTKPEPDARLPLGALTGEIPGLTFDLSATGKPFAAKLANLSLGNRTLLLNAGGTPAIKVDLNPQANRKVDLSFSLSGSDIQVTAAPELNLLLDLKYSEDMTPTLRPFMKAYTLKLPAGVSSLKVGNRLGIDLVILLLDTILSQT